MGIITDLFRPKPEEIAADPGMDQCERIGAHARYSLLDHGYPSPNTGLRGTAASANPMRGYTVAPQVFGPVWTHQAIPADRDSLPYLPGKSIMVEE